MTATRSTQELPSAGAEASPLHIVLVRHGQTDGNLRKLWQGPDALMNREGERQAKLVARRLASFEPTIEALISSDLPRALQTARPVSEALGLDIEPDAGWRERGVGIFENTTPQQREELRRLHNLGPKDLPPGVESLEEFESGIRRALLRLVDRCAGRVRCAAVITHGGAGNAVARMLADGRLPAAPGTETPAEFNCPNASVTHLIHRVVDGRAIYSYGCVFDTSHLTPQPG